MQSATPDSPPSSPIANNGENNLQPFFVLHKVLPRKGSRKASGSGRTRRKLDSPLASPNSKDKSGEAKQVRKEDYEELRFEAFDMVWSKVETTIEDVLRNININVFDVIHQWVCESFSSIRSAGRPGVLHSYPLTSITCKQIFTGLVFTKNVEFVDDLLTFKELGMRLKSHGGHVVTLSSLDFTAKNGIGGCLRSVLRQLIMVTPDTADISIIASWYSEQENNENPVVVIIDDMERCNGHVLSEFILMLSEWVIKIPIILIMGVATTIDAPRKLLTSNALQYLSPCKFTLGSPAERMDAIMEAVLVELCTGFNVGYNVAVFLRNYFLRQDGTVTSFIRALKIACAKHFSMEPLSFLCEGFLSEDSQSFWIEKCKMLPEAMLTCAFDLPSCERKDKFAHMTAENLASGLSMMKRLRKDWSSVVLCLYEAGKFHKIKLFDIFCEALDPNHQSGAVEDLPRSSFTGDFLRGEAYSGLRKGGFIYQAVRRIKDLTMAQLSQLLQIWRKHTEEISEIHGRVEELQSMLDLEGDINISKQDGTGMPKKLTSRSPLNIEKDKRTVNEKAVMLMECMVKDYLQPIECMPFHEIVCFKHVDILQSALIGDPRKMIQVDLLKPHNHLHCCCCSKSGDSLLPSMNDTSIIYTLSQEHGDLINLHDWFQSFKAIVLPPSTKNGKRKLHMSPVSKKRKETNEPETTSEASIQARFCKAVTELQITGLLRMPSRRRPDFVQRVAFGF